MQWFGLLLVIGCIRVQSSLQAVFEALYALARSNLPTDFSAAYLCGEKVLVA